MTQRQARRREAVAQAWVAGDTLDEVGRKFGVTQQRVHQIVENLGAAKYQAQRREVNRRLVAQYNPTPVCQRCREPLQFNGKKLGRFCKPCSGKLRLVRIVQARLRKVGTVFQSRGYDCYFYLSTAAYLIRKHNLKPEDFR
ncbi:hypothetical protein LCGC14_0892060 [marine sediment metagenome]|uniref:RNA polymerase sigma-70 region 4 domain-containing protein n=1 Tax=marine sediment metagenome TaxID=412755 RepID=A0A0F9S5V7_9ZZZZ